VTCALTSGRLTAPVSVLGPSDRPRNRKQVLTKFTLRGEPESGVLERLTVPNTEREAVPQQVPAVEANSGRQPLAREQLVHGDPGEPRDAQCQGGRDRPLSRGDLLDRVPLVAQAFASGPQAPTRSRRNRSAVRTALCSLLVRSFTAAPARAARRTRTSARAPR
jgi:hypothetical protein